MFVLSFFLQISRNFIRKNFPKYFCNYIYDPVPPDITEPLYVRNSNESLPLKKARLLYQSRKRGMLENDLLLSTFAQKYLDGFNKKQLDYYDHLINDPSNEWDLYYWMIGKKQTPEKFNNPVMDMLKEHAKNGNKEKRTRQPSLY